ncbi:macrolide family glycosyltransferase [Parasphingorhabdus pacifica]
MHFLFVSPSAHGHVNPTLPLVAELTGRGHRVTYATHDMFRSAVEATGATLASTGDAAPPAPPHREITPEAFATLIEHLLDRARATYPSLVARFDQDPPDAVCFDTMTILGSMLAEKFQVPAIPLTPSFASNEHFSIRDHVLPADFDLEHPALLEAFGKLGTFAEDNGLSSRPQPLAPPPHALNIVFVPRQFQIAGETFDDRFRFVGPSPGTRVSTQDWQPPGEGRLLFISLGTVFNNDPEFFRTCLDAFGDGSWQVAMATGTHIDHSELGPIPDNVEIRPHFPQLEVLRHADAFVSHAGMNSTMEALDYGVPLITVPQMGEQEANANRVEELGLGRRLDAGQNTADELRTTVDEVADDAAIRGNITNMSEIVRHAGGAVAAAEAIEAHLAELPTPVTSRSDSVA